jgi:endonuclease YncB( thermonuclease family)
MVTEGLARVSKPEETAILSTKMIDSASFEELAANLKAAESSARRSHRGMWRYGDVGDDDPDDF